MSMSGSLMTNYLLTTRTHTFSVEAVRFVIHTSGDLEFRGYNDEMLSVWARGTWLGLERE